MHNQTDSYINKVDDCLVFAIVVIDILRCSFKAEASKDACEGDTSGCIGPTSSVNGHSALWW